MRCLVTGASGFVGGHVAEALRQKGHHVRTVVRKTSDTRLLKDWGVELIEGDIADPAIAQQACDGIDAVVHCAAKVGEWGPIEEYRKVNVEALEHLLKACVGKPLHRFVLVSSLGVYEAKDHFGTDESAPLPKEHIDSYTQTKVEAEQVARQFQAEQGVPLVILRPGFIYGPRDRTVMPRILKNLKRMMVTYFGSRQKKINNVYVGNVVESVLLALDNPNAVGKAYNITDPVCVTKKVFFETIAKQAGLPKPLLTYPMWMGKALCKGFESAGRAFHFKPMLNMARYKFLGLNLDYSITRARTELGYQPSTTFESGMQQTMQWLRAEGHIKEKAKS